MHGVIRIAVVLHHVAGEEVLESAADELPHAWIVEVAGDEGREARQETVREGLSVDAFDDVGRCQTVFAEEALLQLLAQLVLQQQAHQQSAEHGAATLIAEDEAQGRDVGRDRRAVVEAGVGAGAKDAGDARLAAAGATRGAKHIAAYLYNATIHGQVGPEHLFHAADLLRGTPRAEESDSGVGPGWNVGE